MEINNTGKEVSDSLFLGDLHQDVQDEILSNLPVKSLIRFRCASQAWNDLTKSSYFISRHLIHAHQHSDPHHPCLIFRSILARGNGVPQIGFSLLRDQETMFLKSPFLASSSQRWMGVNFVGSGNGLVCYEVLVKTETEIENNNNAEDEIERDNPSMYRVLTIVWNPTTQKYRCLPEPKNINSPPPLDLSRNGEGAFHLLGFDFVNDHDISEYKLVRISYHDSKDGANGNGLVTIFEAQVFLQSTNCWRQVKDTLEFPSCQNCDASTSTTVNGVLYWKVEQTTFQELYILSFNLLEEVFNVIQVPTSISCLNRDVNNNWAIRIWSNSPLIGPFIHYTINVVDSVHIGFWVIRSTDQEESKCCSSSKRGMQMQQFAWAEQLRFDYKEFSSVFEDFSVIGTWKDQLIFGSNVDNGEPINLYLYDPRSNTKRKILKNDIRSKVLEEDITIKFTEPWNYVESLAPV